MNHAILGYLELAQDVLPAEGCHKELIERPVKIINKSTQLIKDVRMLRQVRAGEIEMKKTDAGDMLSKAVANTAHNGDVRINYRPMSGYEVMANESLHDAFTDIINNFIEYSKRPLVIDIEAGKRRENGKEYYKFAFEDNGPGIPDALKRELLGTWGVNEKPVRRSLGFQFIKALIDAYHGKVWMEDRVPGDYSKGVKIVVMLPATE
jgi:signal transduction histidine kinase